MSDVIGGDAAAQTPPENAAPVDGASAGTNAVERPAWAPEKFWDGEKGELRQEDLATSYGTLQKLIGSKVGELGAASKRQLVEALPDEMKQLYGSELRTARAADEEFLKPLREAWLAEAMPKAPEAYTAPEGVDIDIEHPAFAKAAEIATKCGMSQEAFNDLVGVAMELLAPYEGPLNYDVPALKEAIGPDVEQRAAAVGNRVRSLVGPEAGNALLRSTLHPEAFLALAQLVKASSEGPLPLDGDPSIPGQLTEAQLRHDMLDPRYWNPSKRDPSFVQRIEQGFKRLHSDRI